MPKQISLVACWDLVLSVFSGHGRVCLIEAMHIYLTNCEKAHAHQKVQCKNRDKPAAHDGWILRFSAGNARSVGPKH